MQSFASSMREYKAQMQKGAVPAAYRGLMEYILALRTHFKKKHAAFSVPCSLYYGYMDMSYFSIVPPSLKDRQLKIAVVFIHETCRFEAWLAGTNKQVQAEYWKRIKDSDWRKYRLVPTLQGADSILEHTLADDPDFSDLNALTARIEAGVMEFIGDVEGFLAKRTGDR